MKFRPKRRKRDHPLEILEAIDIDDPDSEGSEDDEADNIDIFGPTAPLTPPHSPTRHRKKKSHSRDVLRLHLHHGDILIQQGPELQKYYEHAAVPMGFRIVATARYIDSQDRSSGPAAADVLTSPGHMQDIQNTGVPSPPDNSTLGHITLPLPAHSSISTYSPYHGQSLPIKPTPRRPSKMSSGLPIQKMIPGLGEMIEVMPHERRPPEIVMRDRPAEGDEWMWRPLRRVVMDE